MTLEHSKIYRIVNKTWLAIAFILRVSLIISKSGLVRVEYHW